MKLGRIDTYTEEQIADAKNLLGNPVKWDELESYIGKKLIIEGHTGTRDEYINDYYTVVLITDFREDDSALIDRKGNIVETYGSVFYTDNDRTKKENACCREINCTNGRYEYLNRSHYSCFPPYTLYEIKED